MRANDVELFATKQGTIGVGRRWYRGWVRLRVVGKDKVRATNYVHAEAYLAGVIGGEMPPRWPLEALKTQAIAARTYALYQISHRGGKDFDLYDDTRSQVYHGVMKETPRVIRAVTETSGVVGTYHPGEGGEARLFSTFYHSTCGGETEDVRYGLGERLIPPLVGGPCRFCKDSPLWRWSGVRISKHDLRTQLAAGSDVLKQLGKIEWVRVENRTPSGRARDLRLRDNRGAEFLISARYFRRTVKGVRIPSTGFKIIDGGEEIELSGFGFGHGVGMCQYGARFLADHGKSAVQILRFYYPDIWLVRAY
jgi:stage II sporulation protein D